LQDRWNEINNMDEGQFGTQAVSGEALSRWSGKMPGNA
jgi:hypothetical protein